MTTELSRVESAKLENLEIVIAAGLETTISVGLALRQIRDERLYRDEYDTFDEYMLRRWNRSKQRASQLIAYAETREELSTVVDATDMPERHTRELIKADKEQWPEIVEEVKAKAESEERKPTSNDYREAVQARKPEAAKVTANHRESFEEATDLLRDLINTEERYQVLADWSEKLSALLTICEFRKKEASHP